MNGSALVAGTGEKAAPRYGLPRPTRTTNADRTWKREAYFGAGFYYLDDNRYRLPLDVPPADALFPGASWSGDALGMVKVTGRSVSEPAMLTMTSIDRVADGGHTYNLYLDVACKNVGGDRVEMNATSEAGCSLGADFLTETRYRLQGTFLGPEAKEASGIFETPIYYGTFGVKR